MEHEKHSEKKGEHHEHHSKKTSFKDPFVISTIVLGAVVLLLLGFILFNGVSAAGGQTLKGEVAGGKLVEFLNGKTQGGVSYVESKDIGNLYEVTVSYQGQEIPVFVTKDGKYFVQGAIPLEEDNSTQNEIPEEQEIKDVPKSDKPVVELFVMTHCPYGTQAEKGMIPTIKALGNKANATIRFVHYFMHGEKEETETYNQLCIREEQNAKYLDYLSCFLEDGNTTRCIKKVGLNQIKLNDCISKRSKGYFEADQELSQKYGVQGSPTLVVNGVQVSSGRDSQSFLNTICDSFNTSPTECTKTLSSANPSPGFGVSSGNTAATNAQC